MIATADHPVQQESAGKGQPPASSEDSIHDMSLELGLKVIDIVDPNQGLLDDVPPP